MGFEDFILKQKTELGESEQRDDLRRQMVESAERTFKLVDGAYNTDGGKEKFRDATSENVGIEAEVKARLRQYPHNDGSGVRYYALEFVISGRFFPYATFNRYAPITYQDKSATELMPPVMADKEVLEIVRQIESAQIQDGQSESSQNLN